jgi:hypothetical protein
MGWWVVLRGSRCRLGFFYKFCISWFSSFDESLHVYSRESLPLHLQFNVCESDCLPFVASSFNLEPCSKHIGDSQFSSIERGVITCPQGSRFLTCN